MYICLCNAITDRDLHQAVAHGASRPLDVYTACRCRVQCGACSRHILARLRAILPVLPVPEIDALPQISAGD